MKLTIRLLRETDGRWIGDVSELPGVIVYGSTREEATTKTKALALRVIAEELDHGELKPMRTFCSSQLLHERVARDEDLRSHRTLRREGWPQYRFAYHDREELGPVILSEIAKHTGLSPKDF